MRPENLMPVVKILELECPREYAFVVFTADLGRWWPLVSHSCFGEPGAHIEFEGRVGGQVIEINAAGERAVWGTVSVWSPPAAFEMTWHPGLPETACTRLHVRFDALGPGRCRLTLTHDGWVNRGPEADAIRDGYDAGWVGVLAGYRAAVTSAA